MSSFKGNLVVCSFTFFIFFSDIYNVDAQDKSKTLNQYLTKLPIGLVLLEDVAQKYQLTTHWFNRDISGHPTAKFVISGEYTRGLEADTVRWHNVQIAVFQDPAVPKSDTLTQEWMEGFSYKTPNDIAKLDFFKDFPKDETIHLLRTLIWDAVAFEAFAWPYFDMLELNKPFKPSDLDDFTVQMDDWGTLKMKDLKMTWTGISKRNDEPCAVIHYESFVNPVASNTIAIATTGRSLYWGNIWVSLQDKQIEYATMNEDVIMDVKSAAVSEKKLMNIQREVKFEKIVK